MYMDYDSPQYTVDPNIDVILAALLEYREHSSVLLTDELIECAKIYRWIHHNRRTTFNVFILLDEMSERTYLNLNYFLNVVYDMYQSTPAHIESIAIGTTHGTIGMVTVKEIDNQAVNTRLTRPKLKFSNLTQLFDAMQVEEDISVRNSSDTECSHIRKVEFKIGSSAEQWVQCRDNFIHIKPDMIRRLDHIITIMRCRVLN